MIREFKSKNQLYDFVISEKRLREDHRQRAVFLIGVLSIIGIGVMLIP